MRLEGLILDFAMRLYIAATGQGVLAEINSNENDLKEIIRLQSLNTMKETESTNRTSIFIYSK